MPDNESANRAPQAGWCWCARCEAVFFEAANADGFCVDGQAHVGAGRGYSIRRARTDMPDQSGWRWCRRCSSLFFGAGEAPCFGGEHHESAGDEYVVRMWALAHDDPTRDQRNWRWCRKCHVLFYESDRESVCPAGGGHSGVGSSHYILERD